jgi:hypothetical protein
MVAFGGHTDDVVVVDENVVVRAVVDVDTVVRTVDVKVVENTPPKGANRNIVDKGVL